MLFQVDLGYATFGLVIEEGLVTEAPPIANWMIGKDTKAVWNWIKKKNGSITRIW